MIDTCSVHASIYQLLDRVIATASVPTGARGAIFKIVDHLRSHAPRSDELFKAERISIELHKLELALTSRHVEAANLARYNLKTLAGDWLNSRIRSTC